MIRISEEVAEALLRKQGVVALESTILTHGLKRPENLEVGRRMEQVVRQEGAVPATIAMIEGKVHVGLSDELLIRLTANDGEKINLGALPFAIARGQTGGMTVSATMWAAASVGISIFATGGIGGVHRNYARVLDISADLHALATISVAVVCSGAKSILDLPNTLEVLETYSVPVIGYQTNTFPAFYCRSSSLSLAQSCVDEELAAAMIHTHFSLNTGSGLVLANPIAEEHALAEEQVEIWVQMALRESRDVQGKDLTPFLLKKLHTLSNGKTLQANIALIEDNVRLAARLTKICAEK